MKEKTTYPLLEKTNPLTCISGNIMKCQRIIANIFRKYLKPFEITDSQMSIMFMVTKAKEVNQKVLADRLYLEKSTVNRNIRRLIDRGYIMMDDQMMLHTTEEGKQVLEKIIPHWEMAMQESKEVLGQEGMEAVSLLTEKLSQ